MPFNTLRSQENSEVAKNAMVSSRPRLHCLSYGRKPVLKRNEVSNDNDDYSGSIQRSSWHQGSTGPVICQYWSGLQCLSGKPGANGRNRAALLQVRQTIGRDGAATRGHTTLCLPRPDPHLTPSQCGAAAIELWPPSNQAGLYQGVPA